jgi:hypothetical protein
MIIFGLVLLIAAAVFGLDLMWKNSYSMRSPALFGQTLGIHNTAVFFLAGAITGAVLLLGIALMLAGLRRKGARPDSAAATARKPGTSAASGTTPGKGTRTCGASSTTGLEHVPVLGDRRGRPAVKPVVQPVIDRLPHGVSSRGLDI